MATAFQPPVPPGRARPYRWVLIFATAIVVSGIGFRYYTRHNYPPEVAAKLRKGLRAELDGGGSGEPDYPLALQYYLEALAVADEVGLSQLSDEYTGMQIKIAQMYEKLEMLEEARLLYREMGTSYIQALAEGKAIPPELRPHLIQRDLRVALKTAVLESVVDPHIAKMGLLVHCVLAQNEVARNNTQVAEMMKGGEKDARVFDLMLNIDSDAHNANDGSAWEPFRDELFSARDMFVALCLATGDIGVALHTKLATTNWMNEAGCDVGEVLMSFYNAGSICYLQAEQLELQEAHSVELKLEDQSKDARIGADMAIEQSRSCFNAILEAVQNLPGKARRDHTVAEVHALSTYGLGVISLHKGEYGRAKDLLREARLRAKGCEFDVLVTSAELELDKLTKILDDMSKKSDNEPAPKYDPPSLDVVFFKPKDQEDHEKSA